MKINSNYLTREEVIFDPDNKTIQLKVGKNLTQQGITPLCLYSYAKEEWTNDVELIKYHFPLIAVTETDIRFQEDWRFKNLTSMSLANFPDAKRKLLNKKLKKIKNVK